jgi:hypothetical protein
MHFFAYGFKGPAKFADGGRGCHRSLRGPVAPDAHSTRAHVIREDERIGAG